LQAAPPPCGFAAAGVHSAGSQACHALPANDGVHSAGSQACHALPANDGAQGYTWCTCFGEPRGTTIRPRRQIGKSKPSGRRKELESGCRCSAGHNPDLGCFGLVPRRRNLLARLNRGKERAADPPLEPEHGPRPAGLGLWGSDSDRQRSERHGFGLQDADAPIEPPWFAHSRSSRARR